MIDAITIAVTGALTAIALTLLVIRIRQHMRLTRGMAELANANASIQESLNDDGKYSNPRWNDAFIGSKACNHHPKAKPCPLHSRIDTIRMWE